jgi:hypothetical protein
MIWRKLDETFSNVMTPSLEAYDQPKCLLSKLNTMSDNDMVLDTGFFPFSVFGWGQPSIFFKYTAEIIRIFVADRIANFLDGNIRVFHQFFCALYADFRYVVDKCYAKTVFKQFTEIVRA